MGAREVLAKLRAETRRPDVEDLEHAAREEERAEEYVKALGRERWAVEAALARSRVKPPGARDRLANEPADLEPPSWGQRVASYERQIADIDREIERVSR